MLCPSPRLTEQLHYYLAYLAHHTTNGEIVISINNGEPRLLSPEIRLFPGDSPGFDFTPPALTSEQGRLLAWLGGILHELGEQRAEGKIRIRYNPQEYGIPMPYSVLFLLHRGLNGARRNG